LQKPGGSGLNSPDYLLVQTVKNVLCYSVELNTVITDTKLLLQLALLRFKKYVKLK